MTEPIDWNKKYSLGHISLADAIAFELESTSPQLYDAFLYALFQHQYGEKSIDESLGIAITQRHRKAMEKLTTQSHIRFLVDSFAEQGHPKTDPGKFENTAFHKAADRLCKAPSTIFDLYYSK